MKGFRRHRNLLRNKITLMAFILVCIATMSSLGITFITCSNLIKPRAEELEDMFMTTAVDTTNRYLNEVSEIINQAINSDNLEIIMENSQKDKLQQYSYVAAISEYEKHLRSIILNYDSVYNFMFIDGDMLLSIREIGSKHYKAQVKEYYDSIIRSSKQNVSRPFFLLSLQDGLQNKIGILSPIFSDNNEDEPGCIVVVLGDQFSSQLQFAGDDIYLEDQVGTCSYVTGSGKPNFASSSLTKRKLDFEGWMLVNKSLEESILKSFISKIWIFVLFGLGYIILAVCFAYYLNNKMLNPILGMNNSLKKIASQSKNEQYSSYRVTYKKNKFHFKHRLMILYSILAIIPVIVFSAGFYCLTQNIYDKEIGYFFEHRTNFLFDQLDLSVDKFKRATVELAYNADTQKFMKPSPEKSQAAEGDMVRIMMQMQTKERDIMNISLFDGDGRLHYSSFYSKHFIDYSGYQNVLSRLHNDPYHPYWGKVEPNTLNQNKITLAYTIFSIYPEDATGEKLGYLTVDFQTYDLEKAIADFQEQGDIDIYLFDKNNSPILPNQDKSMAELLKCGEYKLGESSKNASHDKKQNILLRHELPNDDWTAIAVVPKNAYLRERFSILIIGFIIILLLLLLCVSFSYFSSVMISKNMDAFIKFVKNISNTHFQERFSQKTGDEIEELGESFNEMLDTIDRVVEQKLQTEIKIKDTQIIAKEFELNLLQSQINPHFLYNTLKTVQYMVHVQDTRAERMIKLLIQLFRTGICKGEQLVTVQEELNHVKTYLEIQQIRFSDKFNIIWEIDENVTSFYILKLTLQPIVENAIYHGLELLDRNGTMQICAKEEGDDVIVTVADDGNGMTSEKLFSLQAQLEGNVKSDSIGLFNVHERIQLFFGRPYGVSVESSLHKGTRVTLRFSKTQKP